MSDTDYLLQHTDNMRVAHLLTPGSTKWRYYVVTANGYVVCGPFGSGKVGKEHAEIALKNLRRRAREELVEGDPED